MSQKTCTLRTLFTHDLGGKIGQLRAVPVDLGGGADAILTAHAADFDVDPWHEMFYFPTDTLKLTLIGPDGRRLWQQDLGRGVVPGMWFCPILPFDLDGDGVDEIWYAGNKDPQHPLSLNSAVLERIDPRTGKISGQWPWPRVREQQISHTYRRFIVGAMVKGEAVLVVAQGTYEDMRFDAFNADMSVRWQTIIPVDAPGARGSHMCPVVDINDDGVDELMWGERCIELDGGKELFCADGDSWHSHSDIIQPCWDLAEKRWRLFTCREGDDKVGPRIAGYDGVGHRLWGDLDHGHIDMGWAARLRDDGGHVCMGIRIGLKTCGPDGRFHRDREEFTYDLKSGRPVKLPFEVYQTVPVDLNGDGLHELVRGIPGSSGQVIDRHGNVLGSVGGPIALACRCADHAGEQVLSYHEEGTVRLWADEGAADTPAALARYESRFYRTNRKLGCSGSNGGVLGGV